MVAEFAQLPDDKTVATMVIVALAFIARLPIVQFGAVQVPTEGIALTNVYPVGSASFTTTPVDA